MRRHEKRTDLPASGRYAAASKMLRDLPSRLARNIPSRTEFAEILLDIRHLHGSNEALAFRDYCLWIGCKPSGGAYWKHFYARFAQA